MINLIRTYNLKGISEGTLEYLQNKKRKMIDASIKVDNEDIMINCPDGYDARTAHL